MSQRHSLSWSDHEEVIPAYTSELKHFTRFMLSEKASGLTGRSLQRHLQTNRITRTSVYVKIRSHYITTCFQLPLFSTIIIFLMIQLIQFSFIYKAPNHNKCHIRALSELWCEGRTQMQNFKARQGLIQKTRQEQKTR